jgi:hypothetical protein
LPLVVLLKIVYVDPNPVAMIGRHYPKELLLKRDTERNIYISLAPAYCLETFGFND